MSKLSIERKSNKIYVRYYHCQSKILIPTQLLIDQKYWDSKNKSISKHYPDYEKAIFFIEGIFQKIRKIVLDLVTEGHTPFPHVVSRHYFGRTKTKVRFWDFVETYISEGRSNKRPSTVANYLKMKRLLKSYEQQDKITIEFENINLEFYHRLQGFFTREQYSDNYFGSIIKLIKTLLTDATERGFNNCLAFKHRKFKIVTISTDATYLNEQELENMFKLDLSSNRTLETVRDWFIIGSYTALRYSDLSTLLMEHFSEDTVKKQNIKTGKWVALPIHPFIKQILDRNNGLPNVVDHSDFNKRIKVVAKLAGVTSEFTITRSIANKRITKTHKKWQVISSHTMRRSFASNLHKRGFPLTYIMPFTGHKTVNSVVKYLKGDYDEATHLLRDFWGFDITKP